MKERHSNPIPIVIDCDPGLDDAICLLAAAGSEAVEVRLVTTVAGNVGLDKTTRNARGICKMAGLDVEIAQGASRPLAGEPISAAEVHGVTGLGGHVFADKDLAPLSDRTAIEALVSVLTDANEPVTVVAVGPLTNVAQVLEKHPEVKEKIARFAIMGGGLRNGNSTPAAEFNFLADPEAAEIVFQSGVPIVMAGLDVTEVACLDALSFERLREHSPYGTFLDAITQDRRKMLRTRFGEDKYFPNDAVPLLYLIAPNLFATEDLWVDIETTGRISRGMSIADRRIYREDQTNCTVITEVDLPAFQEQLLSFLGVPASVFSVGTKENADGQGADAKREGAVHERVEPFGANANAKPHKKPLILDCDPGVDDAIAIVLAANLKDYELVALTTVSGNVTLDHTTYNARLVAGLLHLDLPISVGANQPLVREVYTAQLTHGKDGFGGQAHLFDAQTLAPLDELSAVGRITRVLREASEKVTIVAIGPLTNIATVLLADPTLKEKIEVISIMGGGLQQGNTTPVSEFNFYVDPEAAHIVLHSGVPIVLAGLDVTLQADARPEDIEQMHSLSHPVAKICAEILSVYAKRDTALHDPVALLSIAEPELVSGEDMCVDVDLSHGPARGMSFADTRESGAEDRECNCHVLKKLDRKAFFARIQSVLEHLPS